MIAGTDTRYSRLKDQDHDHETDTSSLPQSPNSYTDQNSHPLNATSRSIIRRRRQVPSLTPIQAMSLVGLKNLFFRRTVKVTPVRSKSSHEHSTSPATCSGPLDLNNFLPVKKTARNEANTDLELQSSDSKNEKANQRKGLRIDARVISDATIGLSDGLTVPFALTAGLSALGSTKVVIYGGFAELIAGAISMGLGGYLGAKSEAASYRAQREETQQLITTTPQIVIDEITGVFQSYDVPKSTLDDLTRHLVDSPRLVDFVMQFQHSQEPASSRAFVSAFTIALAYFLGGLLPLLPYFCVGSSEVYKGLYISIGIMVVALFVFGYVKTCVVIGWDGGKRIRAGCFGGVQMVVVGGAAAGAAMGLVKLFNHHEGAVVKVGA